MLTPKALLLLPAIAGSLAFTCGGDARPAASADSLRPTPSAAAPAQTSCPSEADMSRIVGITLKRAGAGSSCVYMSDDQESSASLMLRGAASGDQLIKEAREEAARRSQEEAKRREEERKSAPRMSAPSEVRLKNA